MEKIGLVKIDDSNMDTLANKMTEVEYEINPIWMELASCVIKNINGLVEYINEKECIPDIFVMSGVPFTMEMYDVDGVNISWLNKKLMIRVEIKWIDRYVNIKSIISGSISEASSSRDGIHYVE